VSSRGPALTPTNPQNVKISMSFLRSRSLVRVKFNRACRRMERLDAGLIEQGGGIAAGDSLRGVGNVLQVRHIGRRTGNQRR
jgi:hypothetical protein